MPSPQKPYVPTGRPPGRPRKDGLPKANENPDGTPKAAPAKPAPRPEPPVIPGHPANAMAGTPKPGPFPICLDHWPGGWPKGWTTAACSHGIWARAWIAGQ